MQSSLSKYSVRLGAIWLLGAALITIFSLMIYAAVQQDLRQSANDPQIQAAEDVATSINSGSAPTSFDSTDKVDIAKSLSPYIFIYDAQGKILASSGQLNGTVPAIPLSALQASIRPELKKTFLSMFGFRDSAEDQENSITWQPQPGVRSAITIVSFTASGGGYVVVGRSLRQVELREDHILKIAAAGWFALMVVWAAFIVFWMMGDKKHPTK